MACTVSISSSYINSFIRLFFCLACHIEPETKMIKQKIVFKKSFADQKYDSRNNRYLQTVWNVIIVFRCN